MHVAKARHLGKLGNARVNGDEALLLCDTAQIGVQLLGERA